MKTINYFNKALVFIVLALLLLGCSSENNQNDAATADLISIRLPMGYIPNIQYAPFYVAKEKGYYLEAGFDVQFDYSFETDGVTLVGAGELPFAIVSGEQVLLARAQELPVVYIMAWFQNYPITIMADSSLGLETLADLKGHTISLPGLYGASYIGLRALLNEAGLKEQDVILNSIGYTQIESFLGGQSEVVVGYINNEPIQLQKLGRTLDIFRVADYLEIAGNGLISNEAYISEHQELVQKFVDANLKGLRDVIANPEEAYTISLNYVEGLSEQDKSTQLEVLTTSIELWRTETIGLPSSTAWVNMHELLLEMGLLQSPLDISKAFTTQFIRP